MAKAKKVNGPIKEKHGDDGETVHVIQPDVINYGEYMGAQRLEMPVSLDVFNAEMRAILERRQPFTLVLGQGFEATDVSAGFVAVPCGILVNTDTLRFMKERGLRRFVMARLHGTLAQNARAIGIDVVVGGT